MMRKQIYTAPSPAAASTIKWANVIIIQHYLGYFILMNFQTNQEEETGRERINDLKGYLEIPSLS